MTTSNLIARRPRIFLSSTILDFKDLRSAVKFWLEEQGYDVLASEYNDFAISPEQNSYDNCIKNIESCDYFILFIGSRVGGYFDAANKISITRQEYRCALAAATKNGSPKLITFARRSVWDAREDRRGLEQLLKNEQLEQQTASRIAHFGSKIVEDADAVFAFLSEVARLPEMKEAIKTGGPRPGFNWVHQFDGFRDVADTLREVLPLRGGLRRVIVAAGAISEIAANLTGLFTQRADGSLYPSHLHVAKGRRCITGSPIDIKRYDRDDIGSLALFSLMANSATRMSTSALSEAVASGEFLDYDTAAQAYVDSQLVKVLIALRDNIAHAQRLEQLTPDSDNRVIKTVSENRHAASIDVRNSDLARAVALCDRYDNIVRLGKAACLGLASKKSIEMPRIAGLDMFGSNPKPALTTDQIREWIEQDSLY